MLNLRNRDGTNDDTIKDEVADVQNYDREQYRKVFELEKDWVKRWTDDVKPHTQLDRTVEQRTEKESEKVINLLEIRIDNLDKLGLIDLKPTITTTSQQNRTYFTELLDNAEVIRFYNDLIRSYINLEITQDTREAIKTNIQSLRPYIDTLVFGINAYINKYIFNVPLGGGILAGEKLLFNKTYLLKLLTALAVYTFMQKSLFRGTYSPITKNDIDFQLNEITSKLSAPHKIIYNNALVGNNITKSQVDAEARRIRLLTDDQNAPLSDDQVLQMQRSIFGANLASRGMLTPAELNALQPDERQIEEYRQAETEAQRERDIQTGQSIRTTEEQQRQQAEQRILAGLPPLYVEPEIPTFETTREKQDKDSFTEEKKMFDDEVNREYNTYNDNFIRIMGLLNNAFLAVDGAGNLRIPNIASARTMIRNIKVFNYNLWKSFFTISKKRNSTVAEQTKYIDDMEIDYPNISGANITALNNGVGDEVSKRDYRDLILADCEAVGQDMETQRNEMLKIYEDKKRLLGYGKPLYHRKYRNNSNIYFNDDKNDYYNF
jgi:hypothetical protein